VIDWLSRLVQLLSWGALPFITMKHLISLVIIASSILLYIPRASASGINLICTEKGGSEKKKDKSGESENILNDLWDIPVFVDTNSNKATLWGVTRDLSIKPDKLHIQEFTDERTPQRNSTKIQVLIIDRKTLSFTYRRGSTISSFFPPLGLWTLTSSSRESYGNCTKVKEQKGNKI